MLESQAQLPFDPVAEPAGEASWVLRRSPRARRLALRVHLDGRVEVVVPRGVPDPVVRGFMERHRDWVRRKLADRPPQPHAAPFPPAAIELPALGQRFRVQLAGGRGRLWLRDRSAGAFADGLIQLGGELGRDHAEPRSLLLRWLAGHGAVQLEPRLRELADRTDFRYSKLQLRRQRTRWGSCSSRGVISLNVCALFQPPEVLDYLLIHELAHTRHMNHSAAFWRTVAEHCADYRRLDRDLGRGWRRVPAWVFR